MIAITIERTVSWRVTSGRLRDPPVEEVLADGRPVVGRPERRVDDERARRCAMSTTAKTMRHGCRSLIALIGVGLGRLGVDRPAAAGSPRRRAVRM